MPTIDDVYKAPQYGWTCFHCGDTFTSVGAARDHFGGNPDELAACKIKAKGGELALVMLLRKTQDELAEWIARAMTFSQNNDELEHKIEQLESEIKGRG